MLAAAALLLALTGPFLLSGHGAGHAHGLPLEEATAVEPGSTDAGSPCAICEHLAGAPRASLVTAALHQPQSAAPLRLVLLAAERTAPSGPERSCENPRAPPSAV